MSPRQFAMLEHRAYEIGLCATNQPLKMIPFEVAVIPEVNGMMAVPRLENMIRRYNMEQFDRLSQKGYRLNLVKGEYEKTAK